MADIERWAGDLRSGDDTLIAAATENLGQLGEDALPAIEERLQRTARQIVPEEDGYDALRYFRHAVGSRRADDMVDIAPGISEVVKERPSPDVGRSAERLLLLRSLERIGSVPAQRLMGDVFALTPSMWRWERRRMMERMGARLLPGLLWMRAHDEPDVRRWARAAIDRLGLSEPGRAVQEEDPERLAGILEAYGVTREMDAMTVIISFVGHSDERVRQAARDAMNLFGRNGIWQLREGMRNQLGQEADHEWGWQRTSALLYEGLDAQRLGPVTQQLEQGMTHIVAGELAQARELFDAALIREPMHPRRSELAEHYARFAADASGPEKESLLQRALWLNPDSAQAQAWGRELVAVEVRRNVAAGFVDVQAEEDEAAEPIASGESSPDEATQSESFGNLGVLLALALLLAGLFWKRTWIADKLRALRPHRAEPKTSIPDQPKRRGGKALLRWKERLGPLASKVLHFAWTSTQRMARELLSLVRTVARVVSPNSASQNRAPRSTVERTKRKPRPAKASKPKRAEKLNSEVDTVPLVGLVFQTIEAHPIDTENEEPDTVDTALEDMPVTELPAGFFADTSPGIIEAPDTLPG